MTLPSRASSLLVAGGPHRGLANLESFLENIPEVLRQEVHELVPLETAGRIWS
jgi:hypothetical protein